MRDITGQNFGYLIAYVLPGFVLLLALNQLWPGIQPWLEATAIGSEALSVGGFLYVTLASVAAGLTASTVRWLVVDAIHHRTGIRPPVWNDSKLQDNLNAFEALVSAHYRYYQFYGNTFISMVTMLAARAASGLFDGKDVVLMLLCWLYWAGSRDTLRRYYRRTELLLGATGKEAAHDERPSSSKVAPLSSPRHGPSKRHRCSQHDATRHRRGRTGTGRSSEGSTRGHEL